MSIVGVSIDSYTRIKMGFIDRINYLLILQILMCERIKIMDIANPKLTIDSNVCYIFS